MNALRNLKIGARLGWSFAATVALMAVITVSANSGLSRVEQMLTAINEDYSVKVFKVEALKDTVNQQARSTRNLLLLDKPETLTAERKLIGEMRTQAGALYEELDKLVDTSREKALLAETVAKRSEYVLELEAFLKAYDGGLIEDARTMLVTKVRDRQLAYMKSLSDFSDLQRQAMKEAGIETARTVQTTSWVMVGLTLAGALLAALAGWLVTHSITVPIGRAVEVAQRVASGDLTSQVVVDRHDETGALLRALKSMNDNLVKLVGDVRASSDSIATGSSQIATGSADLSQRTEEQASNLQQTAASMEQLNVTVKTSADTAAQATQLAGAASTAATRGGDVVGQVVGTMQQISEASRRISDIIGVIDGIAFQTNILALNAAVEAARAGEQGRGFAVVAGEVRSLAQRSAQAAKEIKSLIVDSVEKVDAGAKLADTAGQTMGDIVTQVKRVTDMIAEIGAATQEQTSGIGQINDAVSQLDQVTQQNAALVEESTAAAGSLREQAQRLVEVVAQFRIGTHDAPAGRAPAAPVAAAAAPTSSRPAAAKATLAKTPSAKPRPASAAAPAKAEPPRPVVSSPAAAADDGDWQTF